MSSAPSSAPPLSPPQSSSPALSAPPVSLVAGAAPQENRHRAIALRRPPWYERDAQPRADGLQIGADQQRLTGSHDVFSDPVGALPRPLRQRLSLFNFQLKMNFISLFEGDVEDAGVEQRA